MCYGQSWMNNGWVHQEENDHFLKLAHHLNIKSNSRVGVNGAQSSCKMKDYHQGAQLLENVQHTLVGNSMDAELLKTHTIYVLQYHDAQRYRDMHN